MHRGGLETRNGAGRTRCARASRDDKSTLVDRGSGQPETSAPRLAGSQLDWVVWQLTDSAFPTGGFAHSAGLEAAWQYGEVRNRQHLAGFLRTSLHQVLRAALPYVNEAHRRPSRWHKLDEHCDAFTTNHVANRASRLQGRALSAAVQQIFRIQLKPPEAQHYAPAFGALLQRLTVPAGKTRRLFLFTHLRSVLAAAVRLNITGPMEAQMIQRDFTPLLEALEERGRGLTLKDLAQTAPLLDLWQGAQDRLYSRLFQS